MKKIKNTNQSIDKTTSNNVLEDVESSNGNNNEQTSEKISDAIEDVQNVDESENINIESNDIKSINTNYYNTLLFIKTRNVKSPLRGHATDAGIDFFCPKFDKNFVIDLFKKNPEAKFSVVIKDEVITPFNINTTKVFDPTPEGLDAAYQPGQIVLYPGERILIPSGIKMKNNIPGSALIAFNKSGVATNDGLCKLAEVVDEPYIGEIHISVVNTSNLITVGIIEDLKLIQFVHLPVIYSTPQEITMDEFEKFSTDRGNSGFGSTGLV